MKTKEGDFIEISFIAKIKETDKVFDLTNEEDAKKYNLYDPKVKYKPIIICIGESNVVKGLDKALGDKEINKEYTIEITPEDGFGKKDPRLIQLVNTNKFIKQDITPFPGLQINIDGLIGIIKTVTGGRTLVDFNHPLAGKHLIYTIKINKIIKDDKEKLKSLLYLYTKKDIKFDLKEDTTNIDIKLNKKVEEALKEKIKKLIPKIKKINFKTDTKE